MKSYQEGREHAWDLSDPTHQFSPAFLYNQLQYFDEGSTLEDNFTILTEQGCASLVTKPYDAADYRSWPSGEAYREAIPYRALSYDYLGHGEIADIFDTVKAIAQDSGERTLAPGAERRLEILFRPQSSGEKLAKLNVAFDAGQPLHFPFLRGVGGRRPAAGFPGAGGALRFDGVDDHGTALGISLLQRSFSWNFGPKGKLPETFFPSAPSGVMAACGWAFAGRVPNSFLAFTKTI